MKKLWTQEEDDLLLSKKLPNESWMTFARREMPDRGYLAVTNRARRLDITNPSATGRKFFFKKDVWREISQESCYWAGFLAADGCLLSRGNSNRLSIELQSRDEAHLRKFIEFTEYTNKKLTFSRKFTKMGILKHYCSVNIYCGESWIEDLKSNFSIVPSKTHILQPPKIDDEFLKLCYVIGYIDGDGTIDVRENVRKIGLSVTGASFDIIEWIHNIFINLTENCRITNKKPKIVFTRKYFKANLQGNSACAAIDYLSKLPVPKLERKWNSPELISYIQKQKSLYPDKFLIYSPNSL